MSIATQTGDNGTTALLFGRRVPKTDARIFANGAVDELNAALGLARASLKGSEGDPFITAQLFAIQKELVTLMGEIAVNPEDRDRHGQAGFGKITPEAVDRLTAAITDLEKNHRISFRHWATPGETPASAALDLARTVCRRAERETVVVRDAGDPEFNPEILRYLNRLSDLCWLWARWIETRNEPPQPAAVPVENQETNNRKPTVT